MTLPWEFSALLPWWWCERRLKVMLKADDAGWVVRLSRDRLGVVCGGESNLTHHDPLWRTCLKPAEEEDESGNTAWAPQEQRSLLKAEKKHLMHLTLMLFYQKALLHQQGGKWLSDVAHSLSYKMEQNRGWKKHRQKVVNVLVMIITMIKGTLVMVIVSTCRERINRHVLYNWVKYSFRNYMEICLPWWCSRHVKRLLPFDMAVAVSCCM